MIFQVSFLSRLVSFFPEWAITGFNDRDKILGAVIIRFSPSVVGGSCSSHREQKSEGLALFELFILSHAALPPCLVFCIPSLLLNAN